MAANAVMRPAVADHDSRAAQETSSPTEQADIMAKSESEQAVEKERGEEYHGARDKA
jgi:hypothetical protein